MSFIVVKYGKDLEKLFNTNSKVINLLHCIRESCGCKDCDIDLAEESTGVLQFLPNNLHEHTNAIMVAPKATYVLVKIQKSEDGTTEYVPMIDITRSNFLVKPRSTRTKNETARKRGDKKTKDEDNKISSTSLAPPASAAPALEIPSLAVPAGGSASLTPTSAATTPNHTTLTPTPASAAAAASGSTSNPASAASTPSNGTKRSPQQQTTTTTQKAGAKKSTSLFPKIDGSSAADAQVTQPVSITTGDEATLVTTSPIITPASKKRTTTKKTGSILEPI